MAITNAQQYKQLLANGGSTNDISLEEAKDMAPKGEFLAYINKKEAEMLKDAGGSGIITNAGIPSFRPQDYGQEAASKKAGFDQSDTSNPYSKASQDANKTLNDKVGGGNNVDEVALPGGTKTKPKVTKTKDKKEKRKNFIKDYLKNRQELAFNISMLAPRQKARSSKYQKAYKAYLESMGVTPPDTLTGEEDDLANFFVNNAFDKPVAADANLETPQSYGEFLAENFGAPGVMMSGNVGGLETFVKTRDADGKPLTYGYTKEKEGGGDNSILPISQPVASEPEVTGYVNPVSLLTPRIAGSRFLGTEFEDEEDTEFAANGGRIGAMGGGIMDTDVMGGLADGGMDESGRQMYFLGKLVKKAKRAVKKITKSKIGKAALLGALGYGLGGGTFFGKMLPGVTRGGQGFGGFGGLSSIFGNVGDIIGGSSLGDKFAKFGGSKLMKYAGLPAIIGGLMTKKEDDDEFDIDAYYAANRLNSNAPLNRRILGTDFYAADGGMPSKEPVAEKTMPLLDMDGQEMDLRAEGGFVPLGRMERADDVPARLSKNEFVFTADAVRNAGEGDIDKGAEVMYNMMKNLESGGEVSEESQGLEGAREMFQTSQRLEEVI